MISVGSGMFSTAQRAISFSWSILALEYSSGPLDLCGTSLLLTRMQLFGATWVLKRCVRRTKNVSGFVYVSLSYSRSREARGHIGYS